MWAGSCAGHSCRRHRPRRAVTCRGRVIHMTYLREREPTAPGVRIRRTSPESVLGCIFWILFLIGGPWIGRRGLGGRPGPRLTARRGRRAGVHYGQNLAGEEEDLFSGCGGRGRGWRAPARRRLSVRLVLRDGALHLRGRPGPTASYLPPNSSRWPDVVNPASNGSPTPSRWRGVSSASRVHVVRHCRVCIVRCLREEYATAPPARRTPPTGDLSASRTHGPMNPRTHGPVGSLAPLPIGWHPGIPRTAPSLALELIGFLIWPQVQTTHSR
jgi:hypothetical protein